MQETTLDKQLKIEHVWAAVGSHATKTIGRRGLDIPICDERLGGGGGWAQNDMAYSSNKQITMHRQIGTSEERMHRSASIKLLTFHSLQLKKTILELPVLLREGIVPRLRALLRRPGKEEGDALRSWEVCWRLISCERLGGGAGMKESARSGDRKGDWLLNRGAAELPARYLQHKSNERSTTRNQISICDFMYKVSTHLLHTTVDIWNQINTQTKKRTALTTI